MKELDDFFKVIQSYSNLSRVEFSDLAKHLSPRKLEPGENLFELGQTFSQVAFVTEGLVKKFYLTADGKEFIKEFSCTGDVVAPYSSLLLNKPAIFTTQAIESTSLLIVEWTHVLKLFKENIRWMEIGKSFAEMHFINREQREFEFLAYSAKMRYEVFLERYSHLANRIKKQDIAAYLGITPVSLSRLLNERSSKV